MVEKNSAWRAEPLTWGQGSRVFEVFLEPTCPFSAKAFGKLDETLQSAGANNVTLKIWLHSQPWHLFSGVITRCALAASTLPLVVSISCNVETFARDARILVDGGFQIESVTPLDQFRFSAHVEIAAVFRRPKLKARGRRLL